MKDAPVSSPWDSEVRLLAWLATCVSVISFLYYFQRGDVLLYGDAIGHLNIARRVFDSKTPGLLQLGTVWLPLPHLLMIPFLLSREMWQRGVGGSIPSMAAYVFGVIGIFRLVRGALSRSVEPDGAARVAAWTAACVFAANPNLIYMQTTAMGEALYLALFLWAVVYFSEFVRGDAKALTKCGLCLAAACWTRYDGWFLAVAMATAVVLMSFLSGNEAAKSASMFRVPRVVAAKFVLMAAAAPALWLAYNGIVYRNPLEFANGPYSAKAIERRTQGAGNPGHPGSGNPLLAEMYFLKSAEANVAENEWLQRTWILFAVAGVLGVALTYRGKVGPRRIVAFRRGTATALFACPLALLRSLRGLRWGPDIHPCLVAIFPLQRSVRTATAPSIRGDDCDSRASGVALRALDPAGALRLRAGLVRLRDDKLRLHLARRAGLADGSPGQHAHAQ